MTTDPDITHTAFVPLHVAAGELGVPLAWLKREADARRIPFLTAGRRRVFDVIAVKRALSARASGQSDEGGAS